MKEAEYRKDVLLVEAIEEYLHRLIAEKAEAGDIEAATAKLAEYRKRLEDGLKNSTGDERRDISIGLADSNGRRA